MGIEQVLRDAAALGMSLSTIAIALAVAVAGSYGLTRTRSLHVVRARLWRAVMGDGKCGQEELARAIQNRDDLIQFRHFLGDARTVDRAVAIARWAREHDEEPGEIYRCGGLFNREQPGLHKDRIPGLVGLILRSITWVAVYLVLAFPWVIWASHFDQALVSLKRSGEWVWLTETSIHTFWDNKVLTANSYGYGVLKDIPDWPSLETLSSLCNWFGTPELKQKVTQEIRATWFVLSLLTVAILPVFFLVWRWAGEGWAASKMLKRISQ